MTAQSMPIPIAGTLADAHGVAIVFHDKSRVTDDFVREAWEMKMKANDGFTERSFWTNAKVATEVVKDRIGSISVPTMVVWGGNDELVPLEQGRAYAAEFRARSLWLFRIAVTRRDRKAERISGCGDSVY